MKVLGITAEYDPFHNGHSYQLQAAKIASGAEYVVAIMSGYFTQRGEMALLDKWTRAEMAAKSGVDLVLELPFVYATHSAEGFAAGAVAMMDALGCITDISFGMECEDTHRLQQLADLLVEEPKVYKDKIRGFLDEGRSFPKARQLAVEELLGSWAGEEIVKPNNILAIEYMKALTKTGAKGIELSGKDRQVPERNFTIGKGLYDVDPALLEDDDNRLNTAKPKPFTVHGIMRRGVAHNEESSVFNADSVDETYIEYGQNVKSQEKEFVSASAIRQAVTENRRLQKELAAATVTAEGYQQAEASRMALVQGLYKTMPKAAADILTEKWQLTPAGDAHWPFTRSRILQSSEDKLEAIEGVTEGLENRIKMFQRGPAAYGQFVDAVRSARFTKTAARRILLHILLGETKEDAQLSPEYLRILAANEKGRELLKEIKFEECNKIPVLTNINKSPLVKTSRLLQLDMLAADMYNLAAGRDLYRCSERVATPWIQQEEIY